MCRGGCVGVGMKRTYIKVIHYRVRLLIENRITGSVVYIKSEVSVVSVECTQRYGSVRNKWIVYIIHGNR